MILFYSFNKFSIKPTLIQYPLYDTGQQMQWKDYDTRQVLDDIGVRKCADIFLKAHFLCKKL
jgi:hypothetical protein